MGARSQISWNELSRNEPAQNSLRWRNAQGYMSPLGPRQQVSFAAPHRLRPRPCRSCGVSEKKLSPVRTPAVEESHEENERSWDAEGRSPSHPSAPRPEGRKRLT